MAKAKPLIIWTAFGPSRDEALLLAAHPDETHDEFGNPRPDRRTLVLALEGNDARFMEEHPAPLARAWYSKGSGVGYCTSVDSRKLYKWQAGKWSEEVFSEAPIDFITFIFGFPGAEPKEDQLFLVASKLLFIRSKGTWKKHSLKGSEFPIQVHGRDPSEVFIGGEPLLKWNGKKVEEIEGPDDGDLICGLWVTADERLVGGDTDMSITTPEGGWKRLRTPVKNFGTLTELDGVIYATSREGMVRVLPPKAEVVSPKLDVKRVANVGDALIALGEAFSLVGREKSWKKITVPELEAGKKIR
jgi:hypothetical protein